MALHHLEIPGHYEPNFLRQLANIGAPGPGVFWGVGTDVNAEGSRTITFAEEKLDDVTAAITGYDASLLAREKAAKLEAVAEVRRAKEVVGPNGLHLDDKTVARLTAAALGLTLDAERESVRWEVTRGNFVTMPRAVVLATAVAAVDHVQACFDTVSGLTDQIIAAADLEALDAIDIDAGWPT